MPAPVSVRGSWAQSPVALLGPGTPPSSHAGTTPSSSGETPKERSPPPSRLQVRRCRVGGGRRSPRAQGRGPATEVEVSVVAPEKVGESEDGGRLFLGGPLADRGPGSESVRAAGSRHSHDPQARACRTPVVSRPQRSDRRGALGEGEGLPLRAARGRVRRKCSPTQSKGVGTAGPVTGRGCSGSTPGGRGLRTRPVKDGGRGKSCLVSPGLREDPGGDLKGAPGPTGVGTTLGVLPPDVTGLGSGPTEGGKGGVRGR